MLVDAPCSGLGTLRRDPDIRWRRREADLPELAAAQTEMLRHAAACVSAGGRLIYSTCSSEPEENDDVVARVCGQDDVVCRRRRAHDRGRPRRRRRRAWMAEDDTRSTCARMLLRRRVGADEAVVRSEPSDGPSQSRLWSRQGPDPRRRADRDLRCLRRRLHALRAAQPRSAGAGSHQPIHGRRERDDQRSRSEPQSRRHDAHRSTDSIRPRARAGSRAWFDSAAPAHGARVAQRRPARGDRSRCHRRKPARRRSQAVAGRHRRRRHFRNSIAGLSRRCRRRAAAAGQGGREQRRAARQPRRSRHDVT